MDKILVVDDDKEIRNILEIYLKNNNFNVSLAVDGIDALEKIDDTLDLVILDIMMPKMDGIETLTKIREKYSMPVIMLSAKGADIDKINGIMTGADDYIVKPFVPMELVARAKGNIRRYKVLENKSGKKIVDNNICTIANLRIDFDAHSIFKNHKIIKLTKTEFAILKLLVKNRGRIYSSESIQNNVFDDPSVFIASNTIAVHIRNLRKKIEDKDSVIIKNVWGVGYKIEK